MNLLIEAFFLVFVGELGDKTQLLALAFATKYKLSTVLSGIAIGIGLNHGLAIIFATFISNYIDIDYIKIIANIIFLVFGLLSLRREKDEEEEDSYIGYFGPVLTIAMTFFIGELGDKTQILAMTIGAIAPNKFAIFLATFSSMMLVNTIGIFLGRVLKKQVPEKAVKIFSVILFLFFGLSGLYTNIVQFQKPVYYFYIILVLTILGGTLIVKRDREKI